jgi:hypothetical protein
VGPEIRQLTTTSRRRQKSARLMLGVAAALRATATAELSYRFSALYWHSDQRK